MIYSDWLFCGVVTVESGLSSFPLVNSIFDETFTHYAGSSQRNLEGQLRENIMLLLVMEIKQIKKEPSILYSPCHLYMNVTSIKKGILSIISIPNI